MTCDIYLLKFIHSKVRNSCQLLSSFSYNLISNLAKLKIFTLLVISSNQCFISQLLKVVGPLGEKFDFFISLGFEIQSAFNHKISKIKFCSGRAFI